MRVITDEDLRRIVDGHFRRAYDEGAAPGISYGVVRGDRLVHHGGLGSVDLAIPGAVPNCDTVFRIASMTKSFTAATALSLRDEGLLVLDRPAAEYVPALARPGLISQVTVRHLLTMSAGFVTDDPWGDRQQDLPTSDFLALLSDDLAPSWRPGRQFEYSNLGYAIVGLVIESVTGRSYREVVRERLLAPLALAASGFDVSEVGAHLVAKGYVRRGSDWEVEPIAGHGAFSPMGGLLSSVRDTARWVSTLLAAEEDRERAPALRPDSLREMASGQRFIEAVTEQGGSDAGVTTDVRLYGFGLFEEHLSWGRSVAHSGGYPGFGSHMRWHPRSGLGIVAMGNRTYAPMYKVAAAALAELVQHEHPTAAPVPLAGSLDRAVQVVNTLLNEWDEELLPRHFTPNVAEDEPWSSRRSAAEEIRRSHGRLHPVAGPEEPWQGPGHRAWWLRGDRGGAVRCEVLVGPLPHSQIQWLRWRSVPEPTPAVRATAERALLASHPGAELGAFRGVDDGRTTFQAQVAGQRLEVVVSGSGPVKVRPLPVRVSPFEP